MQRKHTKLRAAGARPCSFVENAWYERVAEIMRSDPNRFFLFSPQTKHALSIYLDLKERYQSRKRAA